MATDIGGLPHWQIRFDETGTPDARPRDTLLREVRQQGVRHLFVFSHGWNNSQAMAESLYVRFFTKLTDVLRDRGVDRGGLGTVGIIWPSMRWADEAPPSRAGGAAAAGSRGAVKSDGDLVRDLKAVFTTAKQRKALDQMAQMLEKRPTGSKEIAKFQKLMNSSLRASCLRRITASAHCSRRSPRLYSVPWPRSPRGGAVPPRACSATCGTVPKRHCELRPTGI